VLPNQPAAVLYALVAQPPASVGLTSNSWYPQQTDTFATIKDGCNKGKKSMADRAMTSCTQLKGRTLVKALLSMIPLMLAGCFGPPTMHYDVQEYNKEVVSSEKEMLLYNIAELREDQPPHFMMLSNIAQTRSFSTGAAFQWTHLWNNLLLPLMLTSPQTRGSNTYQTNFNAATAENPTFSFVPVQGSDFAQRFESPLIDKLMLFSEDSNYSLPQGQLEWIMELFTQGIEMRHHDDTIPHHDDPCRLKYYINDSFSRRTYTSQRTYTPPGQNIIEGWPDFSRCIKRIMESEGNLSQIDTYHPIPGIAKPKDAPAATDVVSALQANLKWTDNDGKQLADRVKITAWLNYHPSFKSPAKPYETQVDALIPIWWSSAAKKQPNWGKLAYTLPPNYVWSEWKALQPIQGTLHEYVLLPAGDVLYCRPHSIINTDTDLKSRCYPVPSNSREVQTQTQKQDQAAEASLTNISYGDAIADYLWPTTYDYVYFELRGQDMDDTEAGNECIKNKAKRASNTVCGFFKIANFMQIMQRLGHMACDYDRQPKCDERSFVAIGSSVPAWATNWAPYKWTARVIPRKYIWVPAHKPQDSDSQGLGQRDIFMFFTLYKIYQLALVDTSKLVTGTIPITISK
jgi:hypothetical protein